MYIYVENIWKKYDSREVLSSVNLTVDKPMIYSILGPNGAGKSTLLNIIAGVSKPSSGKVLVMGYEPSNSHVRSRLGFCPQEPSLYSHLTGWGNIYFYASLYGIDKRTAKYRAEELLRFLNMFEHADRRVGTYSGGMKKKLSLVISLIHDPDVLILDEPTTGMDPGVRHNVWDLLIKLRNEGKVILIATHYMDEADKLSNTVGIIDQGKLITEGNPEDLKKKYGPPSVISIEFISGINNTILKTINELSNVYYIDGNTLKIHVNDPDKSLPVLVESLYRNNANIVSIKVTKPTLEDVFIKLTGRRLI